ncbi:enoyl-CoA hydratase-related protein [Limibacillus halophilus]
MGDAVLLETRDPAVTGSEAVALLTLNRPEAKNALNLELRQALAEAAARLGGDGSVRAIVITGGPEVFAAGADIRLLAEKTAAEVKELALERYWKAMGELPQPVIAAVNGYALGGGCELALMADLLVAGESAQFGLPEVRLGIMPGAGGTQRLVRLAGKARALRLTLTGEIIDARTAEDWGLLSWRVEGDATAFALELAGKLAKGAPKAQRAIKSAILAGADLPIEGALAIERSLFQSLFDTADQKEGMAAFLEKRKPAFKGE